MDLLTISPFFQHIVLSPSIKCAIRTRFCWLAKMSLFTLLYYRALQVANTPSGLTQGGKTVAAAQHSAVMTLCLNKGAIYPL